MSTEILDIKTSLQGDKLSVTFRGLFDESADLERLKFDQVKTVSFDFHEVKSMNSRGIQKWVKFAKTLPAILSIQFVRCPVHIVNQMNLLPNMMGGHKISVLSCAAPYFCESCDKEAAIMVDIGPSVTSSADIKLEQRPCPSCGAMISMDEDIASYFSFLKS